MDVRLQKRFTLVGRANIDGLLEVFNLFNHANYGSYTGLESSPQYGQPSFNPNVAYQPRMVQVGFRLGVLDDGQGSVMRRAGDLPAAASTEQRIRG